ncbi:apical junction molecule-like isoform X1 [Anser cygnoides]|uniref:apical junction molecule-like isoform X1 n=2 Tax=Anser cygnoides TaxID=8845 RepID=UPI0034D1E37C
MKHYLLFSPLKPEELSLIKELTSKEICQVWDSTSKYIRRQLLRKQVVNIGIGTFAVVPADTTSADGKAMVVQKPVFKPCRFMMTFYKLKCAENEISIETPFAPLDFEQIASDIHFRPEIVEQCIHETLLLFAGALLDKKDVEFFFKGIGILTVRRKVVTMNFYTEFLLEVDDTDNMYEALLTDSKMTDMIASDGKNKYTRISGNSFITLPTLILQDPHCNPISIKPKRDPQPWGKGGRRVSVLDPVVLAQRRVSLAKTAEKKTKEDKNKQGDQARFLPPIQERSGEELKKPKPPAHPRPSTAFPLDPPTMRPFCQLLKCLRRPSHIVRKEYDQMLKERMKQNDKGQRHTSQKAPQGWHEEPQPPRTAQTELLPPLHERSDEELKKPKPPAHPQPKPPEHRAFAQDSSRPQGVRSVRTKIEERRHRILMDHKLKKLEAATWNQYDSTLQRLMMEHRQKNFRHPLECDQHPSFRVRMEYDEKVKERMKENEEGLSPVSQKAPEGWHEDPQPLRRAQREFEPPIHKRSEKELKKPTPPAHPQPTPPERPDKPQDPPTTRARSVRAQMEERRHRILMAHERKQVEDEIWGEYDAILRSRSREREKNPVYHQLECGRRPSCLLRKEYDKKLKERMKENDKGQSPANQKASDGWKEEPQLPRFEPPIHERSEKELKKPTPLARLQPRPPERLGFSAQKTATTGAYYMRALREERREQILMAHRLKRIKAESWDKYDSSIRKQIFERRQKNFHHSLECDRRPSFLLRKEYDEKLKERLNQNVKGQSPTSRKAAERGQEEPQLPRRAQTEKGEKIRLLDHREKAQGVPSTPGNHKRPCSFQLQRP